MTRLACRVDPFGTEENFPEGKFSREGGASAARTTQLPYLPNTFMFPVIVKGEWYVSIGDVSKKLGIPVTTVKSRCLSPQFPDYIWLKDTSNKILPSDKDIQEKIHEFNKRMYYANIYFSPEVKRTKRSTFEKFYKEKLFQEKNKP